MAQDFAPKLLSAIDYLPVWREVSDSRDSRGRGDTHPEDGNSHFGKTARCQMFSASSAFYALFFKWTEIQLGPQLSPRPLPAPVPGLQSDPQPLRSPPIAAPSAWSRPSRRAALPKSSRATSAPESIPATPLLPGSSPA